MLVWEDLITIGCDFVLVYFVSFVGLLWVVVAGGLLFGLILAC